MAITLEQKTEWIKRLRSGEYLQGRAALKSKDNTFCCLGVLADIISPDKWSWPNPGLISDPTVYCWNGLHQGCLGDDVLSMKVQSSLILMNDKGKTFQEIADAIESNKIIGLTAEIVE